MKEIIDKLNWLEYKKKNMATTDIFYVKNVDVENVHFINCKLEVLMNP